MSQPSHEGMMWIDRYGVEGAKTRADDLLTLQLRSKPRDHNAEWHITAILAFVLGYEAGSANRREEV